MSAFLLAPQNFPFAVALTELAVVMRSVELRLLHDLIGAAMHGLARRAAHPLGDVLQGDLAEAWREGNVDYATVALRYELSDTMVDRTSGKIVEGDPTKPEEATELWTFVRSHGGGSWLLSAIQPADEGEPQVASR